MNTDLRKKAKTDTEKGFCKPMNNAFLRKTMENVRKNRDIQLDTTESRTNYLVSQPGYHKVNIFCLKTYQQMKFKKI